MKVPLWLRGCAIRIFHLAVGARDFTLFSEGCAMSQFSFSAIHELDGRPRREAHPLNVGFGVAYPTKYALYILDVTLASHEPSRLSL